MPVWHDATQELRKAGKLQLLGLIQEQHPDRCRLFAQWKGFDWPILVDSLNQLEVSVVPVAVLIDEQGVVRSVLRDPQKDLPRLTAEFDEWPNSPGAPAAEVDDGVRRAVDRARDLAYFEHEPRLSDALRAIDSELAERPGDGRLHFAMGTVYRIRYDSPQRQPHDFQQAVDHWQKALDLNPNQYIWRRRIQQYGPRSEKPYPFYDWVAQARHEIHARGDTPTGLSVEPAGAELAPPAKDLIVASGQFHGSPDPEGRITRDDTLVNVDTVVVPPRVAPGQTVRVHIVLQLNKGAEAHWNNESDPMKVFVEPPTGWAASEQLIAPALSERPLSDETRRIEFELRAPAAAQVAGVTRIPVSAFYNVCRASSGECLYRRKDIDVLVALSTSNSHDP